MSRLFLQDYRFICLVVGKFRLIYRGNLFRIYFHSFDGCLGKILFCLPAYHLVDIPVQGVLQKDELVPGIPVELFLADNDYILFPVSIRIKDVLVGNKTYHAAFGKVICLFLIAGNPYKLYSRKFIKLFLGYILKDRKSPKIFKGIFNKISVKFCALNLQNFNRL